MNDGGWCFTDPCLVELETRLERIIARRGWKRTDLGKLMKDWQRMISKIADGYQNLWFEDYTNELHKRTLLEELIENSPGECTDELLAALRPIDEEFLSVTVEAHWGFGAMPPWCNRVPKNAWPGLHD